MKLDFSGKTILVLGGSGGIGLAAAHAFRDAGGEVTVTGTRAAPAEYEATEMIGLGYRRLNAEEGIEPLETLAAEFRQLDILVNAIGAVEYGRREFERETFRRILEINLGHAFDAAMAFHPALKAARGALVNIGSVGSFKAVMGQPAYSASKGGLLTLTRSLAQAWGPEGIRVNLVAPGFVKTKMTEATWANPKRYEASIAAIPLRRWAEPEEVAGAILFLASPAAGAITGEMLVVDAGMTL